jgi:hypothetical protein
MKRLLLLVAGVALAAVPAVFGLTDNPALSHSVPVRVPSGAVPVTETHGSASIRHDENTSGKNISGKDSHGGPATEDGSGEDRRGVPAPAGVSGNDRRGVPAPAGVSGNDHRGAPAPADVPGKDRQDTTTASPSHKAGQGSVSGFDNSPSGRDGSGGGNGGGGSGSGN